MKDISELVVLDESFELNDTIAQNQQLNKTNRQLTYFVLAVCLLFVGTIYLMKINKSYKDSTKKKD